MTTALLLATVAQLSLAEPGVGPLVDATTVVSDLIVDLRYATAENFLKRPLYPKGSRCWLLPETVKRLSAAADHLRRKGFRLKVYDCYRPIGVQWEMWKVMPKPGYVADPRQGSNHNRGGAVDLTLATRGGRDVEMPTPFDTFGPAAHHDFSAGTPRSRENRETLRQAMEAAGFRKNSMEWWHYDLPDAQKLPLLNADLITGS